MPEPSVFLFVSPGVPPTTLAAPPQSFLDAMGAGMLEMIVFDVGPGEAILLRRRNRAILVDGGGTGRWATGGRLGERRTRNSQSRSRATSTVTASS